eukprot:6704100-Prymnesium_polylepis.1
MPRSRPVGASLAMSERTGSAKSAEPSAHGRRSMSIRARHSADCRMPHRASCEKRSRSVSPAPRLGNVVVAVTHAKAALKSIWSRLQGGAASWRRPHGASGPASGCSAEGRHSAGFARRALHDARWPKCA